MGKTTCAAATVVRAADEGRSVLAVSLDPAHSLGDALGVRLAPRARRVPTVRGALFAVELDADRALARWLKERRELLATILERGTYLDADDVGRLLGLSLPGVDELLGLFELVRLASERDYDQVVVDTAPTGHTLRLLQMPETLRQVAAVLDTMHSKHRFVAASLGGRYHADRADALIAEVEEQGLGLAALIRDGERCAFTWVMLPETLSLEEARDGIAALRRDGMPVNGLIVNRLTPPPPGRCRLCAARRRAEAAVIRSLLARLPGLRLRTLFAVETEPRGLAALRALGRRRRAPPSRGRRSGRPPVPRALSQQTLVSPAAWRDAIAPPAVRLLLFGGKGGVGKTSAAAAAALALAGAPARRVLLLSADPAHSLSDALGQDVGDAERAVTGAARGLRARELDASAALGVRRGRYQRAVDDLFDALRGGSRFDASFDRAVVRDLVDLAPPGMDELFAVLAITDALRALGAKRAAYDLVVLDTAPTGHALRLLAMPDLALEWVKALMAVLLKYRQVIGLGRLAAELLEASRDLRRLAQMLREKGRTAFVAVTRPGELTRRETLRLLRRLRGMGVPVAAVLVNALTPATGCARCRRTAADEAREVARMRRDARALTARGTPMILAPLVAPPPVGVEALSQWSRRWQRA